MSARERAIEALRRATWPDGRRDGFPTLPVAEMLTDALIANALLVTDEQREVYNDLRARLARVKALADEERLISTSELRAALKGDA